MEIMKAAVGVVVDMALMVLAMIALGIALGIATTVGWAIIDGLTEIAQEKIRRKKGKTNGEDL